MKSAYELAMEKLRRQDAARGETPEHLTDAQRESIADVRKVYGARLAEREILYQADLRTARAKGEPEAIQAVEEAYRRDRGRIEEDRDAKIRALKSATPDEPGQGPKGEPPNEPKAGRTKTPGRTRKTKG
jgi:hypothetical protein